MEVTIEDYRSTPDLDAELVGLGYAAVHGGPDQRPVNRQLLQSLLRPTGTSATTLALHRNGDGRVLGAAALRWPATLDATGWLWGPVVHPGQQGSGLGRHVLAALIDVLMRRPGAKVTTSWIPESCSAAWSLFEQAGWRNEPRSALLARTLPARLPVSFSPWRVRAARKGEYLHAAVADLATAHHPDQCPSEARDTFARWIGDNRYTPDGLLLVECPAGLAGAVLVYPCRHHEPGEPAEARIMELITRRDRGSDDLAALRLSLLAAALRVADGSGAEVARAVPDTPEFEATLLGAGFEPVDAARRYTNR